jgi:hypothetical protein
MVGGREGAWGEAEKGLGLEGVKKKKKARIEWRLRRKRGA